MSELIIATKNKGKVKEFQNLLQNEHLQIKSLLDLDDAHFDVEETGNTFEENARLKAEEISNIIQRPVLADDSGLVVDALNGEPGVYSARYAGEPSNDNLNYKKVLNKMENVPDEQRSAHFICVLALAVPGKDTIFKTGICRGKITLGPSGTSGFGYDPIFIPEGYKKTMAQLTPAEKNEISHRYNAIVKLKQYLDKNKLDFF